MPTAIRSLYAAAVIVLPLTIWTGSARAEPAVTTQAARDADPGRVRPLLSAATGVSWISTGGADGIAGASLVLDAGIRVGRIAFVFDAALARQSDGHDQSSRYVGTQTLNVQVWPIDRLWLRGGVGTGWADFSGGSGDAYHRDGMAPAILGAIGAAVVRRPTWALDLELRSSAIFHYDDRAVVTTSFLTGLSWH